jgi:hypothetical protein
MREVSLISKGFLLGNEKPSPLLSLMEKRVVSLRCAATCIAAGNIINSK